MELTVPKGTLTAGRRAELTAFYSGVLGMETRDVEILGGRQFFMRPDDGQFILVVESSKPMNSTGYDHLGLLLDTRAEVDEVLGKIEAFKASDDRVELKRYEDLHTGNVVVRAFYFKFLLPIWFDVQVIEHKSGAEPPKRWQYV